VDPDQTTVKAVEAQVVQALEEAAEPVVRLPLCAA
tara:strand:+ start:5062 stop:5166 length:105 start_codon:yes stop_codon:yes gene_type:complete